MNYNIYVQPIWRATTLVSHRSVVIDLDNVLFNTQDLINTNKLSMVRNISKITINQHIYNMYQWLAGKYPTARRVLISSHLELYRREFVNRLLQCNVDVDEFYLCKDQSYDATHTKKRMMNFFISESKPVFAMTNDLLLAQYCADNKLYTYHVTPPSTFNVITGNYNAST